MCPEPGLYLLEKQTAPGSCLQCPYERAFCNGGNYIGPKPGFWRKDNMTSIFLKCYNEEACLGLTDNNITTGECKESYRGILCSDCDYGYG